MRAISTTCSPTSKAIRYGVTVGEEALSFYGIAKVGRKTEWPTWTPTADIKKRLGNVPNFVEGGPHNPMGARGIYLFQGNKDTLFRIHGTNQPEYIGQAVSSGCIRLTNEDVIDLYNRVKVGSIVVVLAPKQGDSPVNPRVAAAQASAHTQPIRGRRLRLSDSMRGPSGVGHRPAPFLFSAPSAQTAGFPASCGRTAAAAALEPAPHRGRAGFSSFSRTSHWQMR